MAEQKRDYYEVLGVRSKMQMMPQLKKAYRKAGQKISSGYEPGR